MKDEFYEIMKLPNSLSVLSGTVCLFVCLFLVCLFVCLFVCSALWFVSFFLRIRKHVICNHNFSK